MKLGFTTWNYEEEIISGEHNVFSLMEMAKKLGCSAIEFMGYHLESVDDEYLASVKAKAAELGLKISCIDVRNMSMGGRWFQMRQDVVAIKFWVMAAAKLGCPVLNIFLGKFETAEGRQAQLESDINAFREVIAFGEKFGVKFGIENHRVYITDKTADPDEMEVEDLVKVMNAVNSSSLGTIPDTDNSFRRQYPDLNEAERERNYQHFAKMMAYAKHAHIKVKSIDQGEERQQCDMKRLAEIFKATNYQGDICLEFMKPLKEHKDDVTKANLDALKKELSAAGVAYN